MLRGRILFLFDLGRSAAGRPLQHLWCCLGMRGPRQVCHTGRSHFEEKPVYSRREVAYALRDGSLLDRLGVKYHASHQNLQP